MIKYLKKYLSMFFIALLFLLLVDSAQLIIPLVIKGAIDALSKAEAPHINLFIQAGLKILILGLSVYMLRFLWRFFLIRMAHRITTGIRKTVYERLLTFSQHFYGKWETGDIMARATNDLNATRMMFSFGVVSIFDMIFMGATSLSFMIYLNPKLTLLAVIPLPLVSIIVLLFEKKIHLTFKAVQQKFSELTTFVQEDFSGNFVIKSFNREDAETVRFGEKNAEYLKKNMYLAKLSASFHPLIMLVISMSSLIIIYFGGKQVINGTFTLGELVAFLAYLGMLSWPMMAMGFAVNIYQRGNASLKRIEELINTDPGVNEKSTAYTPPVSDTIGIELRDLTFSYNRDNRIALADVSFSVKPHQTVGILGRIGSGKSTLVKTLTRLVDVPDGSIFVGGIDINDHTLDSLRDRFSYVPQEPFLFSTAIRDNIAFYRPDASPDEIARAAEIADMRTTIEAMPEGYDTLLGERGVNLSGGQKQRLTIARAVLKNAPIFIFDDSFSSIDTDTEERILNNLREYLAKKTTIIITHRISSLRFADAIVVLDDGRIVESGTHDELLARKGMYAAIYERQKLEEKLAHE